jgi:hypothetical protein
MDAGADRTGESQGFLIQFGEGSPGDPKQPGVVVPQDAADSLGAHQIEDAGGIGALVDQVSHGHDDIASGGPELPQQLGELVSAAVDIAHDEGALQVTMSRLFAEPKGLAICSLSGSGS